MNETLLIASMAAVTFLIRYSLFAAAGKAQFPARLREALAFVPPAVLAAIIVPEVLIPGGGSFRLDLASPHLWSAAAAFGAGLKTKNLLAVIVSGMAVFWLLRAVLPG